MVESDRVFVGSIPEVYDSLLVPMIFDACARDLAARAAAHAPARVLETAAGSGVVTRALAGTLGPETTIVATDLNPAMLARARARQDDPRVSWQAADALDLPFDDGGFDLGLCQFGAMFFPDRVRGYSEMHRVLRQGGVFLLNVWDGIEANGFADSVTRALAELWPDDPPLFLARTPHGHGDPATLRDELAAAGFARIGIDVLDLTSPAPDARTAATAYCQGTPLRAEIEARDPAGLERATDHAARRIARDWGEGPIAAPIRAFVAEAR